MHATRAILKQLFNSRLEETAWIIVNVNILILFFKFYRKKLKKDDAKPKISEKLYASNFKSKYSLTGENVFDNTQKKNMYFFNSSFEIRDLKSEKKNHIKT